MNYKRKQILKLDEALLNQVRKTVKYRIEGERLAEELQKEIERHKRTKDRLDKAIEKSKELEKEAIPKGINDPA